MPLTLSNTAYPFDANYFSYRLPFSALFTFFHTAYFSGTAYPFSIVD
jgi:hypothetical protein